MAGVTVSLALAAWGTATVISAPASAGPADCGVHLYPGLDPTGEHASGEILDLTTDGIYVGSSSDASGIERATYWIGGVAQQVPVDLEDGDLLDVTENHLAVGDGYDAVRDLWRGYVFDIDTGDVAWLPGIGGDYASARRINEHGVAVGDGGAPNGTGHPLRWRPPYTLRRPAAQARRVRVALRSLGRRQQRPRRHRWLDHARPADPRQARLRRGRRSLPPAGHPRYGLGSVA